MAVAAAALLAGCGGDRPVSEFEGAIVDALSAWGDHVQAVEADSNHSAIVVTDLDSSDPLDYGTALGMCEQIKVTSIDGLLSVGIESVGGHELTYCSPADG